MDSRNGYALSGLFILTLCMCFGIYYKNSKTASSMWKTKQNKNNNSKKGLTYLIAIVPVTNEFLDPPRVSIMREDKIVIMVMDTKSHLACDHLVSVEYALL